MESVKQTKQNPFEIRSYESEHLPALFFLYNKPKNLN